MLGKLDLVILLVFWCVEVEFIVFVVVIGELFCDDGLFDCIKWICYVECDIIGK